jgi:hypothetical protein
MSFNPLEHDGIPLDRQVRNWRELDVDPIDPDQADPYTRCRVITMRRHDGREPEEVLAPELPNVLTFEPNKEYLRELLATQIDLTTLGTGYVSEAHERFEWMQQQLNAGEQPPSEKIVNAHRERYGVDYRIETEGEHTVLGLRQIKG